MIPLQPCDLAIIEEIIDHEGNICPSCLREHKEFCERRYGRSMELDYSYIPCWEVSFTEEEF